MCCYGVLSCTDILLPVQIQRLNAAFDFHRLTHSLWGPRCADQSFVFLDSIQATIIIQQCKSLDPSKISEHPAECAQQIRATFQTLYVRIASTAQKRDRLECSLEPCPRTLLDAQTIVSKRTVNHGGSEETALLSFACL